MIKETRSAFNAAFTESTYHQFLADLNKDLERKIEFRVAETPVFLSPEFKKKVNTSGGRISIFY